MTEQVFTAVIHKEGKWFVAECPELGTISQGKTVDEAIKNLREATALYLEEIPSKKVLPPWITTFKVAVNA